MVYNIQDMKLKTILLYFLIVISVLLVVGILCYLSTKIALPTNLTLQIQRLLSEPKHQVNSDNLSISTSLLVLQNTAFVIQFAAWIFSILAIIVAVLGFMGGKELLNIRRAERKMKEAFSVLEIEHKSFKESRRIEFEFTRARLLYTQGHYDDAWQILSCLPDCHDFEALMYKGLTLLKRGEVSDAIAEFESGLNFPDAEKHRVYVNLGQCWFSIKEYDQAIYYFDKAIEQKSNFADAYIAKGRALRRKGEIARAIDILKVILSLDKQNAKGYYNLSCYYALLGKEPDALQNLESAIKYDQDRYAKLAKDDPDFESIRSSKAFKELLKVKE
jgi:tetratricopeptide (TPR) repeat protein